MTPYVTIHAAPLSSVFAGLIADIPRYVRDTASVSMSRASFGKGRTPAAIAAQCAMLPMIRDGYRVTTKSLVTALGANRFTTYNNLCVMADDGLIKLVRVSAKKFYWEAL